MLKQSVVTILPVVHAFWGRFCVRSPLLPDNMALGRNPEKSIINEPMDEYGPKTAINLRLMIRNWRRGVR